MLSPTSFRSPDHAPPASSNPPSQRRSFTLPARIANKQRPAPASTNSADGIETLFVCSSTKIVSFTASGSDRRLSPPRGQNSHGEHRVPDAIPWRSATERTLAVGVLRIYRVTSSNVSFLNSGNLLHTIFPKSQCWCVDGESVFVLRIRQDSYYRIELPHESEDDKQKAEDFKAVLDQVLRYEKTGCPFTRGFEVQLPERPKTPPRRRPQKPPEKAKKWTFDKTWVPENGLRPSTPILEGSDSGTASSYDEDDRSSINTDTNEVAPESPITVMDVTPPRPQPMPSVAERAKIFQGMRSVTAPMGSNTAPASAIPTPEPSKSPERRVTRLDVVRQGQSTDTISLMSSADSFQSLDTTGQHTPPSPPYLDAEAELINPWTEVASVRAEGDRGRSRHRRQISEATLRAESSSTVEESALEAPIINIHPAPSDIHPSLAPSTPPLISDSDEDSIGPSFLDVATPPGTIRLRKLTGASQRRAFSPMPHPQNLIIPATSRPTNQFTAALIRKTCEIVLGPPAHLVSIMLRIAATISNGAFGFNTYRVRPAGEKFPGSWESSDEDDWSEEDDFGIPLSNLDSAAIRKRNLAGEVD